MILWFVLSLVGMLFIALALRDDRRKEENEDGSVPNLQDLRDLPLRNVREAIKPKPARRRKTPSAGDLKSRGVSGARGPRGLVPRSTSEDSLLDRR